MVFVVVCIRGSRLGAATGWFDFYAKCGFHASEYVTQHQQIPTCCAQVASPLCLHMYVYIHLRADICIQTYPVCRYSYIFMYLQHTCNYGALAVVAPQVKVNVFNTMDNLIKGSTTIRDKVRLEGLSSRSSAPEG